MTTSLALSEPLIGLGPSVERHLRAYFAALGPVVVGKTLYAQILREVERPLLRLTLEACAGNQLRAAGLLGLNRNTLRKKLRDLGLIAPPPPPRRAKQTGRMAKSGAKRKKG